MPCGFHGVKGRQIRFLICMVCARIEFNLVSLIRTTHDSV
jgi:hypothetical protein